MRIEGFQTRPGKICFTSGLVNIFNYHNYFITEEDLVGRTTGLSIYSGVDSDGDFIIGCTDIKRNFDAYQNYLMGIGFELTSIYAEEPENLYNIIEEQINNGLPCMVSCDVYELDYHEEYHRNHNIHIVTVTGVDNDGAYISDSVASTKHDKIYIGYVSNFKSSLNISSFTSEKNAVWSIKKRSKGKLEEIEFDAIKKLVHDCYTILNGETINGFEYGICAIDKLIVYVESLKKNFSDEKTYRAIYIVYSMIVVMGGPSRVRWLNSRYFCMIEKQFGINCGEIIDKYIDISGKWKMAATYLLKATLAKNVKILVKAIEKLNQVRQCEEEAARMMLKIF